MYLCANTNLKLKYLIFQFLCSARELFGLFMCVRIRVRILCLVYRLLVVVVLIIIHSVGGFFSLCWFCIVFILYNHSCWFYTMVRRGKYVYSSFIYCVFCRAIVVLLNKFGHFWLQQEFHCNCLWYEINGWIKVNMLNISE